MSYSLKLIYENFEREIVKLNTIVSTLALEDESLARDTHIEGCFMRMVVSWEYFVEEYFLRCMCQGKTRTNYLIKPQRASSRNINNAFKKINKHRRDRTKDYIDWLDPKVVQQRIDDNFRKNSRVQKICESPDKMYELNIIRNAIAHRSTSAITKFKKYVKDQMGYLARLDPTMASLLIQTKRNTGEIMFHLISNYFYSLANRLTE